MGAATTTDKTSNPPRPPKSPIARQVHFADDKDSSVKVTTATEYAANLKSQNNKSAAAGTPVTVGAPSTSSAAAQDTFAQPTNYPALGQFQQQQQPATAKPNLPGGPGQWYTSATPGSQSVSGWQHSGPGFPSGPVHLHPHAPQHQHFHPPHPHFTCPHHQHHPPNNMSYQNTAPPPTGVNFQPPVPDTSNGPMTHVYIPRFDGGLPQQAPFPQNQFVGAGGPPGVQQHPPGCQAHGHGYVAQPQPVYLQQAPMMMAAGAHPPGMAQPGPGPQASGPFMSGGGGPGGAPPFFAGNTGPMPEVGGLGRTAGEEQMRQLNFAKGNKLFEPQEFKPSDDDPSRFYYVRELDGNWTQRNRFSIDHMGDCRWYCTDEGWFYAVRLPN